MPVSLSDGARAMHTSRASTRAGFYMTDAEIEILANHLAPLLATRLQRLLVPSIERDPIPHKLTVAQFAWCIERSAYFVNEQTRINPKLRHYVQGVCPKRIHPAALALFGVDGALAAARLKCFPAKRDR